KGTGLANYVESIPRAEHPKQPIAPQRGRGLPIIRDSPQDEAHDLPEETLFQIRALAESDLDAPTRLQVLLAGLPKLRAVLQSYPQLWRRIVVREEITGLVFDEVDDFLRHHFSAAPVARLCDEGKTLLFERARGAPGFLLPMFRSVLAAASATKGKIDPAIVAEALQRWDLP
ncbi:MAG: hypothetical protein AB1486_35515, partial [Planctomycetota bacterium]